MKTQGKSITIYLQNLFQVLCCLVIFNSFCFAVVQNALAQSVDSALPKSKNGWVPLEEKYSLENLANVIIPRSQWNPYPTVRDPKGFSDVPNTVKEYYIDKANKLLHVKWPQLPATIFLQYAENGNRSNYEDLYFKRRRMLVILVLAELFQHKGRYLDQITNGIWAICQESFWGLPAHLVLQKEGPGLPDVQHPVVDLFAAQTAQDLAWTYYLLKPELDKINPLIAKRIVYETKRRIFKPFLKHTDWWFMGFNWRKDPKKSNRPNNWDPWINSNVLTATLVLAQNPEMRLRLIRKTMECIDNFVIPYPADGSSDEGPEYWGVAAGSMLDYLQLLKSASGGKINYFTQPVIKKMGQYIYKMNIGYPYFVNYGDADAKEKPDPGLLYRFGKATQDPVLTHFAAFEYDKETDHHVSGSLKRALPALLALPIIRKIKPEQPLLRDSWLPDIQVMTARSKEGSTQGLYLMAKGGTNGASHNHNDVGNYIVYYNAKPILVDAGALTYTKKTFSSHRYEIWDTQSRYHNLPDINGVMEHAGEKYRATDVSYHENNRKAILKLNIAPAYPAKAHVKSWIRTITLNRGKNVVIDENYRLNNYVAPNAENFLTPYKPNLQTDGKIKLINPDNDQTYYIEYSSQKFKASYKVVNINDQRMSRNWGHRLYHIELQSKSHRLHGHYTFKITG